VQACIWARHVCEQAGVEFVLGPNNGKLEELLHAEDDSGSVIGIRTADGREHGADLVLIACRSSHHIDIDLLVDCQVEAGPLGLCPNAKEFCKRRQGRWSPSNCRDIDKTCGIK
jgi:hypothetical protein